MGLSSISSTTPAWSVKQSAPKAATGQIFDHDQSLSWALCTSKQASLKQDLYLE